MRDGGCGPPSFSFEAIVFDMGVFAGAWLILSLIGL
jgi:hypothetical protein